MSYLCINKKNLLMHILFTHFRRFRSGFIQVCFCLGILLLGGCDMIEYHPYDLDIDGETDVNRRNIERGLKRLLTEKRKSGLP